ncbi:Uncharacterized protein PBTT_05683 [Plasmodiophora brassicae]
MGSRLTPEQVELFGQMSTAAGVEFKPGVLTAVLRLLELGASPTSIAALLRSVKHQCIEAGIQSRLASRRA